MLGRENNDHAVTKAKDFHPPQRLEAADENSDFQLRK
jgi:hypothetical protein